MALVVWSEIFGEGKVVIIRVIVSGIFMELINKRLLNANKINKTKFF